MSAKIAVIDTETTWTDKVMSVGVVIADSGTFCPVDSRYYLVDPAFRHGGMYSDVLQLPTTPKPYLGKWEKVTQHMIAWLKANGVEPMYRLLSGNCAYAEVHNGWHDAMDELKIMELLGLPIEAYEIAAI